MGPKVSSGTAPELRATAGNAAHTVGDIFGEGRPGFAGIEEVLGRLGGETQRLGAAGGANFLGFTPGSVGLGEAVSRSLTDPSIQARNALMPLFQRQQNEGLSALFGAAGGVGGRFGGSALQGAGSAFADLNNQQAATLGGLALQGQQAQNSAIANIANALNQSAGINIQGTQGFFNPLLNFAQPGPAVVQPGLGQQLLGVAGTLGGAALGGPFGGALGNRLFNSGGGGGGGGGFPGIQFGPFGPLGAG